MTNRLAAEAVEAARARRAEQEERLLHRGVDPAGCQRLLRAFERAYANAYLCEREWEALGSPPGTVEAHRVDECQGWLLTVLDRLARDPAGDAYDVGATITSMAVSLAMSAAVD